MGKLYDKVAVITGGSSGIGFATAQRFIAEGAYVFITGHQQDQLEEAKTALGDNVSAVLCDATLGQDLDQLHATVLKSKGNVDIIVASAGIIGAATLELATTQHFDKLFNLNVRGTFFCVQKLLPLMTDGGSIVLVSSSMSYLGIPAHSAYAATKAAIRSFSRSWAAELKDRRIRVNTLSPGPTDTPMLDGQVQTKSEGEALKTKYIAMTPLARLGLPSEMASAALFLASSESSFCTGMDLIADGGIVEL